jgi:hypothetical protein
MEKILDAKITAAQGCQILFSTRYQNGKRYTKYPQNIPNGHKIYQITIK